jgi:hypothetical protein
MELIRTRRRDENRFGLAVHISLLRHPGHGWRDGVVADCMQAPTLKVGTPMRCSWGQT